MSCSASTCTGSNMGSLCCMSLCSSVSREYRPDWCDRRVEEFCNTPEGQAANKGQLCSCFKSDFQVNGSNAIAACFYGPCVNGASYKTLDMIDETKKCPSFCGNIKDIAPGARTQLDITQTAVCGSEKPATLGKNIALKLAIIFLIIFAVSLALLVLKK